MITSACFTQQAQSPPAKPAPPPLEFIGEWGTRGDGPGQLSRPAGIAVDQVGSVYVSDPGSSFIHKFNARGEPLLSFQDGQMKDPDAIAVDRSGGIYVFDLRKKGIFVFLPDGARFLNFRGGPRKLFQGPCDLAVDDDGYIFVLDRKAHEVKKFDPRGHLLKFWGKRGSGPGEFINPSGIAVGSDGILYVGNSYGSKILRFTRDAEFLGGWGDTRQQDIDASQLVASSKGVFLSQSSDTIEVWSLDGMLRLTHAIRQAAQLPLSPPAPPPNPPTRIGALAWKSPDQLLVVDKANARVLRFRINF